MAAFTDQWSRITRLSDMAGGAEAQGRRLDVDAATVTAFSTVDPTGGVPGRPGVGPAPLQSAGQYELSWGYHQQLLFETTLGSDRQSADLNRQATTGSTQVTDVH
jgi:hypothetical protein